MAKTRKIPNISLEDFKAKAKKPLMMKTLVTNIAEGVEDNLESVNVAEIKNYDVIADYPELEEKLITTQGSRGCKYMDKMFPTQEVPVKDVSGAGDTFLAGLVVEYVKTKDIVKSIKFAQECTTIVVQKHGVATI